MFSLSYFFFFHQAIHMLSSLIKLNKCEFVQRYIYILSNYYDPKMNAILLNALFHSNWWTQVASAIASLVKINLESYQPSLFIPFLTQLLDRIKDLSTPSEKVHFASEIASLILGQINNQVNKTTLTLNQSITKKEFLLLIPNFFF